MRVTPQHGDTYGMNTSAGTLNRFASPAICRTFSARLPDRIAETTLCGPISGSCT